MIFDTILTYLGCTFIGICTDKNPGSTLTVVHSWEYLEYEFDSPEQEGDIIQMNTYDFRNNLPVDVEVAPDGRIFMTALRKKEVLASLMTITNRPGTGGGPLLRPYPDWSWANTSDCDNIIQVHRMAQDGCNRLWIVDSGKVDDDAVCPAKLLAFDFSTDELIQRIDIPEEFATNSNGTGHLANLVIENLDVACERMNIYMADTYGYGLVIWNGTDFCRIESSYFDSDPNSDSYTVAGTEFHEARGLLGMALTPYTSNEADRLLYFRPLASYQMYHTNVTQLLADKDNQSSIDYITEPTKLQSQSVVHVFSSRGILFFSGMTEMSILCWNRHKPFIPKNIVTVAQDNETLQYVGGMKIYPGDPSEKLWLMTDRGQEFIANKMNFTQTNFRILVGSVDDLVRGTNCE